MKPAIDPKLARQVKRLKRKKNKSKFQKKKALKQLQRQQQQSQGKPNPKIVPQDGSSKPVGASAGLSKKQKELQKRIQRRQKQKEAKRLQEWASKQQDELEEMAQGGANSAAPFNPAKRHHNKDFQSLLLEKGASSNNANAVSSSSNTNSEAVAQGTASSGAGFSGMALPNSPLALKYLSKLKGGCFRLLNEMFCQSSTEEAHKFFQKSPDVFDLYHQGFLAQRLKWPVNPLKVIIQDLRTYPKGYPEQERNKLSRQEQKAKKRKQAEKDGDDDYDVEESDEEPAPNPIVENMIREKKIERGIPPHWRVADLGCGDAELAASIDNKVYSFDLVARNPRVTVADIAHTPLRDESVEVVVLCLALLATNWIDVLQEAHRILSNRGVLKVADLVSRISGTLLLRTMHFLGFECMREVRLSELFVLYDFKKVTVPPESKSVLKRIVPDEVIKPFLYKKH